MTLVVKISLAIPTTHCVAAEADAASEAAWLPLLPAGRGSLPIGRAGWPQGVSLRCGLGYRRECGGGQHDAQCHRTTHGPATEPRPQEPLGHTAQPGAAVPATAA